MVSGSSCSSGLRYVKKEGGSDNVDIVDEWVEFLENHEVRARLASSRF